MKKITIVTAFFNIGRDKFKKSTRSVDDYLNYFAFWARLKNNIIVYTDKSTAPKVIEIRKQFNLENKTKIIVVDDFLNLEKDIYNKLLMIENSSDFIKYRFYKDNPENKAKYNYINFLKGWFINDVVEKKYASGQIAWLDFGFNHGGKVYKNADNFDFEWKYDFKNKISFLCINEDDGMPIFRIVQNFKVYITGCSFVVPSAYASKFWEYEKQSMNELLNVGFMDDDQVIHLMASRKKPEIFNLLKSDWFAIFSEFSNVKLVCTSNNCKQSLKNKLLYKYRINKRNRQYFDSLKDIFATDELM